MRGLLRISGRRFGSKETVPTARLTTDRGENAFDHARRVERRAHDMDMAAFADEPGHSRVEHDLAAGAVADVEDESAAAIGPVADGRRCRSWRADRPRRRKCRRVALETLEVDRAEIIPSDAGDDRAWLTELPGLVDEYGRCT